MDAARMRTDEAPSPRTTPTGPDATAGAPRTLALMNQKGGVGKTTSAVNLAAGLAELGHRTLLIDLDPQAHATLHLGVDPDSLEHSVYDVLHEPESITPIQARENLALLPAVTDLAAAESELSEAPDRQARLTRALAPLESRFDFVMIDCPPSLGLLTLNALAAVSEVIVPMQAHFLALQGVSKLLETVHLVGASVNPDLRVAGLILCMHEENTRHAREVVQDIAAFFDASMEQDVPWKGAKVYKPPVRRNIKLAEAPSFGQTVLEYEPTCPGARDYRALAGALASEHARRATDPATVTTAPAAPGVHDPAASAPTSSEAAIEVKPALRESPVPLEKSA